MGSPTRSWPSDAAEAEAEQRRLADAAVFEDAAPLDEREVRLVAGVDLAHAKEDDWAVAVVSLLSWPGLKPIHEAYAEGRATFPYVPGLLSFRELPLVLRAWDRLEAAPDLVLYDGHGRMHPRRLGAATHLGLLVDRPVIGCAKQPFVAGHPPLPESRGARALVAEGGERIGAAVRTRAGVKPVYVSSGHRVGLETACDWVVRLAPRYRIPEPLRSADHRGRELRAARR